MNRICTAIMAMMLFATTSTAFAGTSECPPTPITKFEVDEHLRFGCSVAIDNGVAVIGTDSSWHRGGAYIFQQQSDSTWLQIDKLESDDVFGDELFGRSVAIDNGVAVIGATRIISNGSAYLFQQQPDGTWLKIDKLMANDGGSDDHFGWSVAIDNGVAVVGAWGTDSGSAYVFQQLPDGSWLQIDKLMANDGGSDDHFGISVAISGETALVGASGDNDNGIDSGSVYVFQQLPDGSWLQIDKLVANDGASYDRFGCSVAINNGVAVIGAEGHNSGSAYLFMQQSDGTWSETAMITASDGNPDDHFGCSVAIDNGVAVVGAEMDNVNGHNSGSAYLFKQQSDGTWSETAMITASDGNSGDHFGSSVAINSSISIIGAPYSNNGTQVPMGSAYMFDWSWNDCNGNGVCDADDLFVGSSLDCNMNGIPDECDASDGPSFDCDGDLVPDECESDCDEDGWIDDCDTEPDLDENGVPDNCDPDCNSNGIADGVEILLGISSDCDNDTVPDQCQLANGSASDCDENGVLDYCQLFEDPALDCDANGQLDSCEVEPVFGYMERLTADDGSEQDTFGWSAAIQDGLAVIGATGTDNNANNSGSAYVYEQQADGSWLQVAKLSAKNGSDNDRFGISVAISGHTILVGVPYADGEVPNTGCTYVFDRQPDGTWLETAKLMAIDGDSNDNFGLCVDINDDVAVIGATGTDDNANNSGSAYVFQQQSDGIWLQIDKLVANDANSDDSFGYSVAIHNGAAVIGATGTDDNATNSGSVYVFEQQVNDTWLQIAKLTATDAEDNDRFGFSVDFHDGLALIGSFSNDLGANSGSAYLYDRQEDGTWSEIAKLTASDGDANDYFGGSVALDDGLAMIGASRDMNEIGDESGSAYLFQKQSDGSWDEIGKYRAWDVVYDSSFGASVALDDGVAIIGATNHTYDDGDDWCWCGSEYIYEWWPLQVDCNANGMIDYCEIDEDPSLDCDADMDLDSCDLLNGSVDDCNENEIPDVCDIANGGDANGNGYLDECECSADIASHEGPGIADGNVDILDLLAVIGYWGSSNSIGDITGDGEIDIQDLLRVLDAWGTCP